MRMMLEMVGTIKSVFHAGRMRRELFAHIGQRSGRTKEHDYDTEYEFTSTRGSTLVVGGCV